MLSSTNVHVYGVVLRCPPKFYSSLVRKSIEIVYLLRRVKCVAEILNPDKILTQKYILAE